MIRSFDNSLRPPPSDASASYSSENLWTIDAARKRAQAGTNTAKIPGKRKATLYLNRDLAISQADVNQIATEIGEDHAPDNEVRSVWFNLKDPIQNPRGRAAEVIQIKGVVFDSGSPPRSYSGWGLPPEIYFADRTAQIRRHASQPTTPIGYCLVNEAVNEYSNCRELSDRLEHTNVPLAVGWGTFDDIQYDLPLGFVVLGLPALVPGRQAYYLEAARKLAVSRDFAEMDAILRCRAAATREAVQRGFLPCFRHFANVSVTPDSKPFMHDLGTPRSLFRRYWFSDEQFASEAFAQLAFAMTPRTLVIPFPNPDDVARKVPIDHLDQYTQSTMVGYYGDNKDVRSITFEDFETTFFKALTMPLGKVDTVTAHVHRGAVQVWLEELKAKNLD